MRPQALQNASRRLAIGATAGLAAGLSVILATVANYFVQRQRLCPNGWTACDPSNANELFDTWMEVQLLGPLVAIPVAIFVGLAAMHVMWIITARKNK